MSFTFFLDFALFVFAFLVIVPFLQFTTPFHIKYIGPHFFTYYSPSTSRAKADFMAFETISHWLSLSCHLWYTYIRSFALFCCLFWFQLVSVSRAVFTFAIREEILFTVLVPLLFPDENVSRAKQILYFCNQILDHFFIVFSSL